MSPPVSSTSNAAAMTAPISETALLADKQCIQQEMDDLEHLLAEKCKQRKELADKWKAAQMK